MNRRSEFLSIVRESASFYEIILNSFEEREVSNCDIELNLEAVRQPVWDFLVQNCPSFVNRDCDAEFSEIFSSCLFNLFIAEENVLFETRYTLKAFCNDCNLGFSVESPTMVNYVADVDLENLENVNDWPTLLRSATISRCFAQIS